MRLLFFPVKLKFISGIIFEGVVVRQVEIVVAAGLDQPIRRSDPKPETRLIRFNLNPIPAVSRFFRASVCPRKMWSSRNQMLNDNDGDDVAFLSGSGDGCAALC